MQLDKWLLLVILRRLIELLHWQRKLARDCKVIPVSVPCHCPLLSEAAESYAEYLAKIDFKNTKIDVVSNVDLSIYHSAQHIREKLKEQLYSPVRWVETIQLIKNNGIRTCSRMWSR